MEKNFLVNILLPSFSFASKTYIYQQQTNHPIKITVPFSFQLFEGYLMIELLKIQEQNSANIFKVFC